MPWPIYSTRFLEVTTGGLLGSYTTPAGYRAVVKNVSVSNTLAVAAYVYAQVHGHVVWINSALAGYKSESFDTMVVAYGGETIQAYSSEPGVFIFVCGYLLREQLAAEEDPSMPAQEDLAGVGDPFA